MSEELIFLLWDYYQNKPKGSYVCGTFGDEPLIAEAQAKITAFEVKQRLTDEETRELDEIIQDYTYETEYAGFIAGLKIGAWISENVQRNNDILNAPRDT